MKPKFKSSKIPIQLLATTSAIVLCMSASTQAATDNLWTGTTSSDWNDASNWSLGAVPTKTADQNAVINISAPNVAAIILGIIAPVDIVVGGAGGNGRLDHPSGDASTGSTNSMYVGTAGGTGVFNLANTGGAGGTHTGFATGSGSMTVNGGTFWVGGSGAGSNGTVNVNTTGTLAAGVAMNISGTGGTAVMNLDNGAVSVIGPARIGYQAGGNGTLNMSGGSITKTGADVMVIGGNGSVGIANVSGGSISVNGDTWVGNGATAGTTGTFNLTGGTFTASGSLLVGRTGATGVLNLNGGTITKQTTGNVVVGARGDSGAANGTVNHTIGALNMANSAQLWIGNHSNAAAPRSTGTYNLDGGSITLDSWVAIGREGGNGTLNMTDGSITKTGSGSNFIIGTSGGGTGTMNMSGGSVTVAPSATADRGITWVGESNAGTFTMSGTAGFQTARITLGVNASASGTVNFNGGTLTTGQITGGAGTANFNFNGGQIIASAASTSFVNNLDTAVIGTGGLKLNTNNLNLATAQVFTGAGGVEKSGAGTLTLTGTNSYAGSTSVSEGKLAITTASTAAGAVSLADSCSLGLVQSAVDDNYSTAAVTFGTSDATTLDMDLGNFAGITAIAPLNVTDSAALALNGTVTINVTDSLPAVGTVPLVSYSGGKTGTGSFVLGTLPDGVVATINDNGTDLVSLNVTRVNDAYWTGAISTTWDTATANWNDDYAESSSIFADGDPVLFDDRVMDVGPEIQVLLPGTVTPGGSGVSFANAAKNYTLSGVGKITGATALTKQGTGTTTIETLNDHTGVTTVGGGILRTGTLTNGGIASPIGAADNSSSNLVLNGGTLSYTGAATTIDRGFTVSGVGSGIESTNDLTITGDVFGTAGSFIKSGSGKLTLAGLSVIFGESGQSSRVDGGTLKLDGTGGQFAAVLGDLWVSATPGVAGHLEVAGGLLSVGGWLALGRGNGDGVISNITATNSVITSANFTAGFNNALANNDSDQLLTLSNSTWNNSGQIFLAESDNATSVLTLTNGSIVNLNNTLLLGRNGANSSGSIVIEDTGAFTKGATGHISLGVNGIGSLTVRDNGSFVANGGDFNISDVANSKGTLNIEDSAVVSSVGTMFVGKGAGTIGTFNISGGILTAGLVTVADNATSTATINQTGGTVNMGNNDRIWFANNGTATWNQSDGTVNASGWVAIGRNAGSNATWNVSGGTLNQVSPANTLILAESGNATLTISGTGVVDSMGYQIEMATRAGSTGTLNLNTGGTLRALQIQDVSTGFSTINLDGGTLVANTGANALFVDGIDSTSVKSGGVTIDSNGQNIGINVALLDGTGGGGLIKTGAGALSLNGVNTYTGATTVNDGTLGGTGTVAGPLLVSASATIAPGASAGIFTAGATTISGTYACEIDGTNCDRLAVNGTLDISAATLAINEINPASGSPLVIATYTGSAPAPFATVTGVPFGYTLDYSHGGDSIALIQSATPYSTWINSFASIPVGDRDPGDDPDGDGVSNIAEFALHGNPASGASTGRMIGKVAAVGGNPTLVLTLPVRAGATFTGTTEQVSALIDGVIYRIQGGDQLSIWDLAVSEVTGGDKTSIETGLPALDSGWTYRTFQSPGSVSGDPAEFLRAVIESP